MKHIFTLLIVFASVSLTSQEVNVTDSIPIPIYDTTSIDITSTNSFYFCNKLYTIPRDCNSSNQSNCCSYKSQITKFSKERQNGQISCYSGTSLHWYTNKTELDSKQNFDGYHPQIKQQMKKFKKEDIKLNVCGVLVSAYKLTYITHQNFENVEIVFYGTINEQNIVGHIHTSTNVKSSIDLPTLFQQLIMF